jgi:hypothetical protein
MSILIFKKYDIVDLVKVMKCYFDVILFTKGEN